MVGLDGLVDGRTGWACRWSDWMGLSMVGLDGMGLMGWSMVGLDGREKNVKVERCESIASAY